MTVACDYTKSLVIIKKGSCPEVSFFIFCIDRKSRHSPVTRKTDLYLQSLKVVFQEREHTSFSAPPHPPPCSINSSWQAETTLIARDEGEQAAGCSAESMARCQELHQMNNSFHLTISKVPLLLRI